MQLCAQVTGNKKMLESTDQSSSSDGRRSKSILLVDDDSQVLESLSFILRAAGYDITAASNGHDAIQLVLNRVQKNDGFDLIITDLGMPGMNGEELAMRAKSILKNTPVVLLSGWASQLNAGVNCLPYVDLILGKPPKRKDLLEAIERF